MGHNSAVKYRLMIGRSVVIPVIKLTAQYNVGFLPPSSALNIIIGRTISGYISIKYFPVVLFSRSK